MWRRLIITTTIAGQIFRANAWKLNESIWIKFKWPAIKGSDCTFYFMEWTRITTHPVNQSSLQVLYTHEQTEYIWN